MAQFDLTADAWTEVITSGGSSDQMIVLGMGEALISLGVPGAVTSAIKMGGAARASLLDGRIFIAPAGTAVWMRPVGGRVIFSTGATAGGAPTPTPTPSVLPNYASTVAFGDSITFGLNATTTANNWANLIKVATGNGTLLNAGISGTVLQNSNDSGGSPRTNNGRDRFQTAVLGGNKQAAIFVAYGFNDARYIAAPASLNLTNYKNDLQEVVNGLIIGGYALADIYLIAPYYISDTGLVTGSTGFSGQTRSGFEAYVAACQEVAQEFGTKWTPIYTYMRDNGYAPDPSDNIHPLDAGHAIIAEGIKTQTTTLNSLAKPATVSGSVSTTTIDATCSAVSGAVSYDFVLVQNYVNSAAQNSATPAFSFTSVTDGTYYVKARAVYSGGSKGPWVFSATSYTVAAAPGTPFLVDSFTDTDGTLLTAHTPDTGLAWVTMFGYAPTNAPQVIGNKLVCKDVADAYRNITVPPSANVKVSARLNRVTAVTGDSIAVAARMRDDANALYYFGYRQASGGFYLAKTVAGTNTQLGSTYTDAFAAGQSRDIDLVVTGTSISGVVDGVTVIGPITDSALSVAGFAGVRLSTVTPATASTGIHMDNYSAVGI